MDSNGTRVHKAVNKVTRVGRIRVLKQELREPATSPARAGKADAVIREWAIHAVEAQAAIKTAAVTLTANDCKFHELMPG